jgi:hypothetical protein
MPIDSNLGQKSGNVWKREESARLAKMPVTFNSLTREGEMASWVRTNESAKEISFDHQMTPILLSLHTSMQQDEE